jgi:hypothetical protein
MELNTCRLCGSKGEFVEAPLTLSPKRVVCSKYGCRNKKNTHSINYWNEKTELQIENAQLKEQINKMKCCESCKSFKTNFRSCFADYECENLDKWEMKE